MSSTQKSKPSKRRTIIIGGIARAYEHDCQLMLDAGMTWLKAHPGFSFSEVFCSLQNVTGVIWSEDAAAKELLDTIAKAAIGGATGAQVQAVTSHLRYIHEQSYDVWLKMAEGKDPTRLFEYDGTPGSCPPGLCDTPEGQRSTWRARKLINKAQKEGATALIIGREPEKES